MIEQSHRRITTFFAALILCTTPFLTVDHPAFATSSTGVMIPLYTYPGTTWTQVIAAKTANPSVPIVVTINPSSGPGSSSDSNFVSGIQQLQAAGVTVLGYVYTSYGSRSTSAVESDINAYINWYHVDGIMFDEMSNVDGSQTYYSTLTNYVHSHGMTLSVGNPGTSTLSSYVGTVDVLSISEGSMPSASTLQANTFNGAYPKSDFEFVAYGVSSLPSQSTITTDSNYVAWIYITNDGGSNPYDTLPSYFATEVAMLNTGSTSTAPGAPTGLTTTASSSSQINLSWTAPSNNGGSGITGYKIEQSTNAGSTWSTLVANTASTGTTYSNTGLAASTAYTYRVSTINAIGTSSPSGTSSATTLTSTSGGTSISLTVNSDNLAKSQINGMWVSLLASNGTTLASGFTPITFSVTSGAQYVVQAANYKSTIFNHWQDGTTNSSLTITPTQNTTLTAYYSTAVTIKVKSVDLSGTAFNGMWTVVNSHSTTLATGYTPFSYSAQSGNTYTVTVANYQNYVFSHWSDGSTNPTRMITPTQNTTLVAYYST